MKTGICLLSVIPVREKPSDKSQMTNQLLFGETAQILDAMNNWSLIRSSGNHYEGWVDTQQLTQLDKAILDRMEVESPVFLINPCATVSGKSGSVLLSLGSRLPFYKNRSFDINGQQFSFGEVPETLQGKQSAEVLVALAGRYLGVPFLWGGRSFFGLACSGFTEVVFRTCGYQLPRDSRDQAGMGKTIGFINEARAGDLAFFDNDEEQIVHVGILLGNTQILHASGKVRIDTIDHQGIFNEEQKKYTHRLRLIKRLLP